MVQKIAPILLSLTACSSISARTVPRVVDGQVERGPFVSAYAYEWFIEGEMRAAEERHDEAAIAFETASAAPTDDTLLLTRLAEEYERSGTSRRADRTLAAARRSDPDSPRIPLAEGRILLERGDREAALAAFIAAERRDPDWHEPAFEIAHWLDLEGNHDRADALLVDFCRRAKGREAEITRRELVARALRNDDPEALRRALELGGVTKDDASIAAAELALDREQPALASRLFATTQPSASNRARWLQAMLESGQRDEARALLGRTPSEAWGGKVAQAELWIEAGKPDEALRLLAGVAPSPRARYARGHALLDMGQYLSASETLSDVPFGSSDFEEARIALADASRAQRRLGVGLESLSLVPTESDEVRRKLGELHVEEGDLRSALRLFDARNPSQRSAIAALYDQAGEYPQAAAYYASYVPSAGDDRGVRARANAERLASRGLYDPAITILDQRVIEAPQDLFARVRLVELLEEAGRMSDAEALAEISLPFVHDPRLRARLLRLHRAAVATD